MFNDILSCGVSTDTHNANIKRKSGGKTIYGWTIGLISKSKAMKGAKEASKCGNNIRQYNSSTAKDNNDNPCQFATRLLGASNRALSIPIENEDTGETYTAEVFPSNSFKAAKEIWFALYEAVEGDETIQEAIVNQLIGKEFQGNVSDLQRAFSKGVTQ